MNFSNKFYNILFVFVIQVNMIKKLFIILNKIKYIIKLSFFLKFIKSIRNSFTKEICIIIHFDK